MSVEETPEKTVPLMGYPGARQKGWSALKRTYCSVLLVLLVILAAGPTVADGVQIPGTKTSLQPPAGFLLADKFPGFERTELKASIMVTEMPAPAAEVMKAMTEEGLASRGMKLLSSKIQTLDGREALLLHVSQMAMGTEFLKWMLVTGDPKTCLIVTGSFPKGAEAEVGEAIRKSVLTTAWSPTGGGVINPFDGLLYRVTPTAKLKLAGRVSNLLMLTESGSTGPLPPGEPMYVVGNSYSDTRIEDLRAFAEARARKTEQLQGFQNFQGRAFELDGLPAYEILADAKDVKTGAAMRLYQVIASEKDGYFIFQGLVTPAREAEMLPEFRRVTETFRRTEAAGRR
jgi:hypothetical protein